MLACQLLLRLTFAVLTSTAGLGFNRLHAPSMSAVTARARCREFQVCPRGPFMLICGSMLRTPGYRIAGRNRRSVIVRIPHRQCLLRSPADTSIATVNAARRGPHERPGVQASPSLHCAGYLMSTDRQCLSMDKCEFQLAVPR
jgi:hypothetical protein